MLWVFWALVGWCGTPWPHRFIPRPPPPPDPDPWWYTKFGGVIGGILGGWVFDQVWPMAGNISGIGVAATAVGAFVGAVLVGDAIGAIRGASKS
jgi:hypothetical protein